MTGFGDEWLRNLRPRSRAVGVYAVIGAGIGIGIGAVLLLAACSVRHEGQQRPPNVVLVTIDTLRADRLGCTGGEGCATPVLDRLAASGMLFDHVIVPVPITLPSHAGLMTGLLPHQIGVRDNRPFAVPEEIETVAEALCGAGYQTLAVVSAEPLAPGCGLEQGFERYLFRPKERQAEVLLEESIADRTVTTTLEAAATLNAESPFFLWVHFFDPHIPYEPKCAAPSGDPYDGEVAFVDAQIGRLLEGLEQLGLMSLTLLFVTSDHGEGLGDHDEPTHAYFLFDTTVRVPLIVCGPQVTAGRRSKRQIRLLDIAGTIPEMCGVDLSGAGGTSLPRPAGELGALLRGEELPAAPRPALMETVFCSRHFRWAELTALRSETWKVVQGARIEAFDLRTDAGELEPLNLEEAGPEARRLAQLLERRRDGARQLTQPGRQLFDSLPGYFGGTAASGSVFLERSANQKRRHPPDAADLLNRFLRAVELSQSGHYNRARVILEDLVQRDSRNPSLVFWLGRSLRALGEKEGDSKLMEEACDLFEKAYHLDPGLADASHMQVWSLIQLGRFEESKAVLDRRHPPSRGDPKALELYGYLFTTNGSNGRENPLFDLQAGLESFKKSLELNQNNRRLLQKMIHIYKSLNQSELEEHYRRELNRLERGF